jgi:hypothetical protein
MDEAQLARLIDGEPRGNLVRMPSEEERDVLLSVDLTMVIGALVARLGGAVELTADEIRGGFVTWQRRNDSSWSILSGKEATD